tara:strand:- start:182584 stop:183045 length:462 start_codon:yes stop_codon:yes gene_type:complete
MQIENSLQVSELENIFKCAREIVLKDINKFMPKPVNDSHSKKVLYEKRLGQRLLKIELIYFTGLSWTKPHTHPECMIENILSGSLIEQLYIETESGLKKGDKIVRSEGHYRVTQCHKGHPHDVISRDGSSTVLSLSFGRNAVEPIDREKLLVN